MSIQKKKMVVAGAIESKLRAAFNPSYLNVVNESERHSVPVDSETHFKVLIVSDFFQAKTRVARHRAVNSVLAEELAGPVHALSLRVLSKAEWEDFKGQEFTSPDCSKN